MKICFFTENYYKGGLDTFLINLFNAWPDSHDKLTLVCNSTHSGLETIIEKTIRPINIKRYSRFFTSKISQGQSPLKFSQSFPVRAFFFLAYRFLQYPILLPWYLVNLTFFFWRSDYERLMVVNGGYPASLLGRCAVIAWRLSGKRPLATFNFHNSASKPLWYFSFPERILDMAVIWSSKHFVSVSKNCLNTLYSRNAFLGCTKLSYIYNGIEDPKSSLKDIKVGIDGPSAVGRYCLMLATYEARKGHAYLLQAFSIIVNNFSDVRLEIYGYGKPHEKSQVANEVKRLGLENKVFLNDFSINTTSLIANASVLVVPSQSFESFGLTIIEAMALGTPVVTTDVGGMPEVIGDSRAGYVCSREAPETFADAINNILMDPVLASDMGLHGRQAFEERFMARTMAYKYKQLIEEVSCR